VDAVSLAQLEDAPQPLGIADVVGDDEVAAHRRSAGHERDVVADLAGEAFGEHAGLQLDGAPVADLVAEDGVSDALGEALFICQESRRMRKFTFYLRKSY
jgi:hypothetical protein